MTNERMPEAERYDVSILFLKSLACPKEIMEAIEIWWMIRGHEVTKLRNWTAIANGQGVIDAETGVKALPEAPK